MARIEVDQHFRYFGNSLSDLLVKYGNMTEEEVLANQQRQFEKLVALENLFRQTLSSLPEGQKAYEDFVHYVCDSKRNILIARPFLRERQDVFTSQISPLLKQRDVKGIQSFHFSYRFVSFIMNGPKDCPTIHPRDFSQTEMPKIAKEIRDLRTEIVETNLPLAINRAGIFWKRTTQVRLQFMDLVQTCVMGLISAVDKFCLPFTPVWRSVAIGRMVGDMIEGSLLDDTILVTCEGEWKKIKDFVVGDMIWGVNDQGERIKTKVEAIYDHGMIPGVELTFDDGYSVICSPKHKFLTEFGQVETKDILEQGLEIYCVPEKKEWIAGSSRRDSCQEEMPFEGRMVDVSFSLSPLSSTRGLVRRKIIQVRSVGPRRMYDLGVSNSKHNFLLPNGVVTSNSSDTLLHFFPNDKKKIYRANKALRRCGADYSGVDFDKLVEKVNEKVIEVPQLTNVEELRGLMAATSNVSCNSPAMNDPEAPDPIQKFAAESAWRPDVRCEESEEQSIFQWALENVIMTRTEKKLLLLKGIVL